MDTVPAPGIIPSAIRKKALFKGVSHGFILVAFLATVEAIIYNILISRVSAEMDAAHKDEMAGMDMLRRCLEV